MSGQFDAYHKWLAIPPEEQPPNYYRLLGVTVFESDADVIDTAADTRMSQLRKYQTGKNAELSQKLLNEIAAARLTLLTPDKRSSYDAKLKQNLEVANNPRGPSVDQLSSGPTLPAPSMDIW